MMQKITPFLWFNTQAEEAAQFYVSVFNQSPVSAGASKIGTISRYDKEGAEVSKQPEGSIMVIAFELDGQKFSALNGGPIFKFTEAISLVIDCKDQEEVDYFWEKLSEGGDSKAQQCGWLKDKFGVSWQVVPKDLLQYIGGADGEGARRATAAMLTMKKLDVALLKEAYEGK